MARKKVKRTHEADTYRHPEAESLMRPDVGTQGQFKKKKLPQTYRYDSSLSPALDWDGQNPAREQGEALIREILEAGSLDQAREAAQKLKALSRPFLDWAGKAERLSFDVPTLPLFVHERLSTQAIIETLKGHKRDKQLTLFDLFGDPEHSIADQVLRAYEHKDRWVNRMILGDSLVVMNSLLHYENLGGQVQMIYMDPPYGVKFGSNFQPFVRKRDVSHNDDEDMTREPEMVQAYRDTWEVGLHSYLSYMRDRLLLCRELLHPSGSVFVQINDENLHHVNELMEEIFGPDNYLNVIPFVKTSGVTTRFLPGRVDFLVWYARDKNLAKYRKLYAEKSVEAGTAENYNWVELQDGNRRGLTVQEKQNRRLIPAGAKIYKPDNITSQGNPLFEFQYQGKSYRQAWKTNRDGLQNLANAGRLHIAKNTLQYVRYITDFPCVAMTQLWDDTATGSFTEEKIYAVQTGRKVIERCLLMTTDPGDLVLDPTCGSGTTAYVAEQWGRRWITADVSRVPLALARQRLLTATFPWYELKDDDRGPAGGFVYKRKQNNKGEEVGGIVPHVTLKSIANNEPPAEEVLVDRPEITSGITRVTGPFDFEGTIPAPLDLTQGEPQEGAPPVGTSDANFADRMLEVLRHSPVLRLEGNRTVTLANIRPPARTLALSAEAVVKNGGDKAVAFVFGPENGAVSQKLVYEALKEADLRHYTHLYVIGFAIQPDARLLIDKSVEMSLPPATYVQATPDLLMGDLLKNMRSSQIFSVCGQPEVQVKPVKSDKKNGKQYQVTLLGLDVFDPVTMDVLHRGGDDVPAWLLDTDYNGNCFHVSQA
ncbi:MAG TPA: site-specific DNA-methyltransferase, partial [Isosphaeraceae bacterium]|nr:site-specific DNA-methyltransferase [Isosphaeraceae bacterium]